jgi:hypothetical protein
MAAVSSSEAGECITLSDVLAGHLGADAVRTLALRPLAHGVRALLDDCLPAGWGGRVNLLRSKYKPDRKLTAYYQVPARSDGAGPRQLAVSWHMEPPRTVEPTDPLTAVSHDGRTRVQVWPVDPSMPQLRRLDQHEHLVDALSRLSDDAVDPGTPMVTRTVRYRPGQRHVLHIRSGPVRGDVYMKMDRDDSGSRAVPVARELGATVADRCCGVALAEPLGYAASERAAVWLHASGLPLWHRLRGNDGPRLVRLVGQALRVLHEVDTPQVRVGSRDVRDEAATTLRAGDHIARLLPAVGATYDGLLSHIVGKLDRLPVEEATFTHGDVKCDNLMVDDGQVRILDLDRCCTADPALDLGKFIADLRWWCPGNAARVESALRDGYGPCDSARWARAGLLAALFQLRFAARRCALHDPNWSTRVSVQVAHAASVATEGRV